MWWRNWRDLHFRRRIENQNEVRLLSALRCRGNWDARRHPFLRPLADNDEAWLIGIVLAAAACFVAATYRRKRESTVEEKPEPWFQDTSPYDGGVIVGSAMAANVGLPGMVTLQSNSGGVPRATPLAVTPPMEAAIAEEAADIDLRSR